jgi:hypothetical protein
MRYRTLAWIPLAIAASFLVLEIALGVASQTVAVRVEVELAKVLWLGGALAAARVFESGDYLRRGWLLIAGGVALFFVRDVTLLPAIVSTLPPTSLGIVRGALVVSGNVCQVAGVWVLARVWSAVGLDDAVSGQRRALFAAALTLVGVITGPAIAHDAASALGGKLDSIPHLASDLGDAATFVLLAAIVRTALALRGGVVFWTWSLLAAAQMAWMLFDCARTITELFGASAYSAPLVESLRVAGAMYICAAGLAQRWVVSARFPVEAGGPVGVLDEPGKMA